MSETTEGQDGEEGVDAKDAETGSVIDSSVVLSIPIVLNVVCSFRKVKGVLTIIIGHGSALILYSNDDRRQCFIVFVDYSPGNFLCYN